MSSTVRKRFKPKRLKRCEVCGDLVKEVGQVECACCDQVLLICEQCFFLGYLSALQLKRSAA
jgi:hypothetical protein